MEEKKTNPIQVSERIFHTIETLAHHGPMGLLDLSKELSLNKTTVHRILNSLICMDYVRQDPESLKYSLTYKFCGISAQILASNNVISLARPHLRKLAEQTGETVHLVQMDGTNAIYIDKVEASRSSVRLVSMVGKAIPLYCSGVGKAMLADMTDERIQSIWEKSSIRSLTEYTITELTQFQKIISAIRQNGYALDKEENELGVRCIAVSITAFHGNPPYAISVSAPRDRMSDSRILEIKDLILTTKENIQKNMGVI